MMARPRLGPLTKKDVTLRNTKTMHLVLISLSIPLGNTMTLWEAITTIQNLVSVIGLYMMKCLDINCGCGHCQGTVVFGKTFLLIRMANTWNFRRVACLTNILLLHQSKASL